MSMWSIFTDTSNSFEDKRSYETVLLLLRRHWFILVSQLIVYLFLLVLPFVVYFSIRSGLVKIEAVPLFWFLVGIYFLVWWSSLFYTITMYLLDVWIVTDHRIIDSEQHGYFNRTVAELSLGSIEDISVAIVGILPTWLNYGNLEVQTAAATVKFFFKQIPDPVHVKDVIMHAHDEFGRRHPENIEVHIDSTVPGASGPP